MTQGVFEVDARGLHVSLTALSEDIASARSLMNSIGLRLVKSILDRTADGFDAEGNRFTEYSPSYKKIRQLIELQIDHVDLFFGGSMLGALTHEYSSDTTRLFFLNTPHVDHIRIPGRKPPKSGEVTNAELAYYHEETRPFFSISAAEKEMVLKMVDDYVETLLKR